MSVFFILALTAYSFSLMLIMPALPCRNSPCRKWALFFAIIALLCHSMIVKQQIFNVDSGQNLSLMNICSIISILCVFYDDVHGASWSWLVFFAHCVWF